jgi:hypothetical protein
VDKVPDPSGEVLMPGDLIYSAVKYLSPLLQWNRCSHIIKCPQMPFQIKGLTNLHINPFFQEITYIYESSQISILKTILPENTYLLFLRWNRCSHIIFHVHAENTNLHIY